MEEDSLKTDIHIKIDHKLKEAFLKIYPEKGLLTTMITRFMQREVDRHKQVANEEGM